MESFSYSPFLPSQSFANFANIFLLPYVEVKAKYWFPLFSSIYPSALPTIRYNGFTLLIL